MNLHLLLAPAMALMLSGSAGATPLWEKLVRETERHIREEGPDTDAADFLARAGDAGWSERHTLVAITMPYLQSRDPLRVAGGYEVLHRIRGYRPLQSIGDAFEKSSAGFFTSLDKLVLGHVPYALSLNSDAVYRTLSLYLGTARGPGIHEALLKVVSLAKDKGQPVICLAWHRNPADMDVLLPIMLDDNKAASYLPYHFREAYGPAAMPYLQRALREARGRFTREAAAKEIAQLQAEMPRGESPR